MAPSLPKRSVSVLLGVVFVTHPHTFYSSFFFFYCDSVSDSLFNFHKSYHALTGIANTSSFMNHSCAKEGFHLSIAS